MPKNQNSGMGIPVEDPKEKKQRTENSLTERRVEENNINQPHNVRKEALGPNTRR